MTRGLCGSETRADPGVIIVDIVGYKSVCRIRIIIIMLPKLIIIVKLRVILIYDSVYNPY